MAGRWWSAYSGIWILPPLINNDKKNQSWTHWHNFLFPRMNVIWPECYLYKPSVYFMWHRQTVQNLIIRRVMIRFCTVCLNIYFNKLNKIVNYYPKPLNLEQIWQIDNWGINWLVQHVELNSFTAFRTGWRHRLLQDHGSCIGPVLS